MSFESELKKLEVENSLERQIISDPRWREGAAWGKPRKGHPEGMVLTHVLEVLLNVERYAKDDSQREKLRLIALIHDSFKHKVDHKKYRSKNNHHATFAREFAEEYISDEDVLRVIERHDDAYNAWQMGNRKDDWQSAQAQAIALMRQLEEDIGLYLVFYRCDNETGSKDKASYLWFENLATAYHFTGGM